MESKVVLVSTEEGKYCDAYPPHSLQYVTEVNQGTYKTPFQNNSFLNMDWIEDDDYKGEINTFHKCNNCDNLFTKDVVIIDNKCPRCIARKTRTH